jgi:hypothetical protein
MGGRVTQDASTGNWTQDPHAAQMLGSLQVLNHQFLDLAASRSEWIAEQVAPLSAEQRAAAAGCPYALFDLRFRDDGDSRPSLQGSRLWRVADEAAADDATHCFVRLALFFAWHVASSATLKAQLLLGMNQNTADALRRTTVDELPTLAVAAAPHLSARWSGCTSYWSALAGAAARGDPAALRRVQLYGLQLAAAARLPGG